MIPKAFASAICLGLLALLAFASGDTPDRSQVAARGVTAPALELVRPILEPSDGIVIRSGGAQFAAFVPDACSDSIASCIDPIKHLGTQNDCACFACGYGTASQRTVCTRNAADKDALFKRAR